MTRWLVLPLVAALALASSAFLDALEETTDASAELARASEDAPARTRAAQEEVGSLPAIATLTGRQAEAFSALADALEVSAGRAAELNDSLSEQVESLRDLTGSIADLNGLTECLRARVIRLNRASSAAARTLADMSEILGRVDASQKKSLRHLRSINRKLAALGIAADVTDVEPPPHPPGAPAPKAGGAPGTVRC